MPFRGLTWDHPRGYAALERAASEAGDVIVWDRQPLEGFESAPIDEVCAGYDLVVLDHPHLGDAVSLGCVQPLDQYLSAATLQDIRDRTLGPSYKSYEAEGHLWALPLDAAAQVSAGRRDIMCGPWPVTFSDVERASLEEPGFVLSLAGPHAFVTMLSLCAAQNDCFGPVAEGYLQPEHDPAIALFLRLAERSDPRGRLLNPIGILDQMAAGYLTFCPLIFGYVPYAQRNSEGVVTFRNAPRANANGLPRGVLGGTGIAMTSTCRPDADLLEHLVRLLSDEMQKGLIPQTSGQPSAEAAWTSDSVNAEVSDFYRGSVETLRSAFLRPRHAGFSPDQSRAAAWLRDESAGSLPEDVRRSLNQILSGKKGH